MRKSEKNRVRMREKAERERREREVTGEMVRRKKAVVLEAIPFLETTPSYSR